MDRVSFCKDSLIDLDCHNLLDIQLDFYRKFFLIGFGTSKDSDEGLLKIFKENFPISDPGGNYVLHFVNYSITPSRYSPMECIRNSVTYSVGIKAKFRLVQTHEDAIDSQDIEQEVYLGSVPYMTDSGSFIINGIERVVVSLIHKSVGVFFSQSLHASGVPIYSVRVIPLKGSWLEFSISTNGQIYVYIDRKKKVCLATFLRAIGYETDKEILELFLSLKKLKVDFNVLKENIGKKIASRVLKIVNTETVDESTGEVFTTEKVEIVLDRGFVIEDKNIQEILSCGAEYVYIIDENNDLPIANIIYDTLEKDPSNTSIEAAHKIYKIIRGIGLSDDQAVVEMVLGLFFNAARYDLGATGRYKINKKLHINVPEDVFTLTKEDIICIIKRLIYLASTKFYADDIDHLANRRVRTVGEQMYMSFSLGISRLARVIKDRLNVRDNESFKISDLVNIRPFVNVINSVFASSSPLSQYMDQVNPLAEISHKRRISATGPGGGFAKDSRVSLEARDVHYTYAGRICPIETPEGASIGLISQLASFAHLNEKGFLETPYRKVVNGVVDLVGKVCNVSVEEEDLCNICQSFTKIDKNGKIIENKVKVRHKGEIFLVNPSEVHYMEVASHQGVSISTSLIPFLGHDDSSRALMAANMQRQAVPLMCPESPIVGTGMEKHVIESFGGVLFAEKEGIVKYVDSSTIQILYNTTPQDNLISFDSGITEYTITKFYGSNQKTSINYRPVVKVGDLVKKGSVLTEGYSTQLGELALGTNLKVAYLAWRGYTYEDAIVVSERLVREDLLTSIHIEEYVVDIRDTKLGPEVFTSEIPNISENAIKNLDKNGLVNVGTVLQEGDILVGKLTPKGETESTPEEKLLKAIFGERAGEVKDTSLRVPVAGSGVVIDTCLLSKSAALDMDVDKTERLSLFNKQREKLKTVTSSKIKKLREEFVNKLLSVLGSEAPFDIKHRYGEDLILKGSVLNKTVIFDKLFPVKNKYYDNAAYNVPEECDLLADIDFSTILLNIDQKILMEKIINSFLKKKEFFIIDYNKRKHSLEVGDELPFGVLKRAKIYVAQKRKIRLGDKMAGRHGNKGIVSRIVKEEDMPFLADGSRVDIVLNPLGVSARMNLGQLLETGLGWAGKELGIKYTSPSFGGATMEEVEEELSKAGLPKSWKVDLYDGLTGEKFDQQVTLGYVYMLKLNHMVDDKLHFRSTEGYSLVTNQPLRGKSQRGGQRFGEMEVWALEAYGAAYTLREMLTIKSDDVKGRASAYEAIVKGKNIPDPGIPEAFKVLLYHFRGLNLDVGVF